LVINIWSIHDARSEKHQNIYYSWEIFHFTYKDFFFVTDYVLYVEYYIHVTVHRNRFLLTNQPGALIIQIYSVIKLYIFRASPLPIISFLLYIRHW